MASAQDDPLDELRVDPRDILAIPHRFATPLGSNKMKAFNKLANGLYKSKIYWTYGSAPKGSPISCVDDPPCSGWSTVLVVGDPEARDLRVLCPYSMRGFTIRDRSHERSSMQGCIDSIGTDADSAAYYKDLLPKKWAETKRHGEGRPDWGLATLAMEALGTRPPTDAEVEASRPAYMSGDARRAPSSTPKPAAGKPATPAAAFKAVKRAGRKGEVLAAILEGKTSADALMDQFSITRSNLLSQLFLLRKDHGIGYKVAGDTLALEMPEGVTDPFAS